MRLIALVLASLVGLCFVGCEYEFESHHRPDHEGGPPGSGNDENGDDENGDDDFNCATDADCEESEGCTQGGQCVDITGTESVTEVLQAEIDDLPDSVGMGIPYELPTNAVLRIDDDNDTGVGLDIHNGVIIDGNGSRMLVENGMIGIRLANGASWSSVRNLRIDPQTPSSEHDGIGIDVRAHGVRLKNLFIRMMGTGIRAHTRVNDDHANVNTQQWSRIILRRNHHHGLHVRSGDSNAGLFTGIEVLGGGGITDDSFLGNTYVAPVIQTEHENAFNITGRAGSSTVLGLYLEDSAPPPTSSSQSDVFLGGTSIRRLQSPGDRIGNLRSRIRFQIPDGKAAISIPAGPHEPLGFTHLDEREEVNGELQRREWRLRFTPSFHEWGFQFMHTGDRPYRWTGGNHPQGPGKYELGEPKE